MPVERGVIEHRDRARQINDFSRLRWNNITPTNIDGSLDFHDESFVFIETKLDGKSVPEGQRRHLEAICKGLTRGGCEAIAVICRHSNPPDKDIDVANCLVEEVWRNDNWWPCNHGQTTKTIIDIYLREIGWRR